MSYDTAFKSAKGLFGRARLSLVAQLTALEDLIHPRGCGSTKEDDDDDEDGDRQQRTTTDNEDRLE
eukprot:CAMPEP_0116568442 /NCGR_PEP_ID=MMETSP0397-20121206/15649_1 /TAXON_ID=216820 /ORGANISM="Cyclophora tenuis, Strain ECT3854" /LENGTH=65 /DNA_ID=CAMNT_0004095713 /DNA_START=15 /DNA_END=209 /DNA_ORIENTATION=-